MPNSARLFRNRVAIAVALALLAAPLVPGVPELARTTLRAAVFGGPLLELRAPLRGQIVPEGGVDVFVSFRDAEQVAPGTFRCLLNGRDVTADLTQGRNGAVGSLIGALEGDNHLRVEVFGRSGWLDRFVEDADEVSFRVRPLVNLDRG
jgi:cold shock CspA family protein